MATKKTLKKGTVVYFGRPQGELTQGAIVRVGTQEYKVKQLEDRGIDGRYKQGSIWTVLKTMVYVDKKSVPQCPRIKPVTTFKKGSLVEFIGEDGKEWVKGYVLSTQNNKVSVVETPDSDTWQEIDLAYVRERKKGEKTMKKLTITRVGNSMYTPVNVSLDPVVRNTIRKPSFGFEWDNTSKNYYAPYSPKVLTRLKKSFNLNYIVQGETSDKEVIVSLVTTQAKKQFFVIKSASHKHLTSPVKAAMGNAGFKWNPGVQGWRAGAQERNFTLLVKKLKPLKWVASKEESKRMPSPSGVPGKKPTAPKRRVVSNGVKVYEYSGFFYTDPNEEEPYTKAQQKALDKAGFEWDPENTYYTVDALPGKLKKAGFTLLDWEKDMPDPAEDEEDVIEENLEPDPDDLDPPASDEHDPIHIFLDEEDYLVTNPDLSAEDYSDDQITTLEDYGFIFDEDGNQWYIALTDIENQDIYTSELFVVSGSDPEPEPEETNEDDDDGLESFEELEDDDDGLESFEELEDDQPEPEPEETNEDDDDGLESFEELEDDQPEPEPEEIPVIKLTTVDNLLVAPENLTAGQITILEDHDFDTIDGGWTLCVYDLKDSDIDAIYNSELFEVELPEEPEVNPEDSQIADLFAQMDQKFSEMKNLLKKIAGHF